MNFYPLMFYGCSAKRLKDRRKVEKFDEKEESLSEDKDTPIKIMDKDTDKMDSNKLLSPELAKIGEIPNDSRSGASSPSPSDGERERECVCVCVDGERGREGGRESTELYRDIETEG